MLPSCSETLKYHPTRANYVSKIWKMFLGPVITLPNHVMHGFCENFSIHWFDNAIMPGDIIDILMNVDEDDEEYYGNEEDSDT